jgi:hypothetical protein
MNTFIRIGILSAIMAGYMGWAFRGIEYDVMETGPALIGYFIGFTLIALIAALIYKSRSKPESAALEKFTFRTWLVSVVVVALGWMIYYSQDPAAAGEFRDNIIVGGLIMAALVGVLNFALAYAVDFGINYLKPKRRRT